MTPTVPPTLTKYGQVACGLCKREPPLGDTGICWSCTQGLPPAAEHHEAPEWDEADKEPDTVSVTNVAETKALETLATAKNPKKPLKLEGPFHGTANRQDEPPTITKRTEKRTRKAPEGLTPEQAAEREKRLARSRAWHAAHKKGTK